MTIPTLITIENMQFYPFKLIRYIHWDRLFKILNLILDKILQLSGYNKSKMQDMLGLISLFVFISFATHVLACFWLLLGRRDKEYHLISEDKEHLSWVYNPNNNFEPDGFKHLYILSVFYVLETITTVGYGDYTGGNTYERVYAMFLEVINFH